MMKDMYSLFEKAPNIVPPALSEGMSITQIVTAMGQTSFEARNVYRGAQLYRRMIDDGDTIWLGIAGAGIAGGMGGMVISLLEAGFIDVICSTGAQVYHDLHFAFDLPVKSISPNHDDNALRQHGDTRIYDIGIREKETLEAQDKIIQKFVRASHATHLSGSNLASWEFNYALGNWAQQNSKYPERSFVACAAKHKIPIFWDSLANHSIAMNLVVTDRDGNPVRLSAQKDIFDSAAIVFAADATSFVELGGGGPKNFIQQTGPTISQILKIQHDGAERGLQIGTAVEKEGSLSGCTFGESVTWGKYRSAAEEKLVQIWGEYSVIFPLLAAYVLDNCSQRTHQKIIPRLPALNAKLENAR
ncbi:MAG: deoxyhypusine synthase family protein [Deltaproteobacteria bacterium]|jgi:deoxyhypusine synthase|nr:deoxyhypusine synthase family protein [Deltaproteobacteria bacterium]